MSITPDGVGPSTPAFVSPFWVWPDSLMVVQEVGEVILDEILTRHAQIQRVPVIKFISQLAGRGEVGGQSEGK